MYLGACVERKVCGETILATQYAEKNRVPVTVFLVYLAMLAARIEYIIPPAAATMGIRKMAAR